ncbi:hypothetical protein F2P45_18375 [Massilia sp. CCM 8733]|uniref:Uncharacterized protein n=2 Tax=Massilia mucilaginosa TaxID=2609282 RepID=A0ABX0NVU9_9BURK|nr:hypothetical protein [Massilia mucilaginosa]
MNEASGVYNMYISSSLRLNSYLFFCYTYAQSTIPGADAKQKLLDGVTSEILEFIYDENFCTYSVCFHRCANETSQVDLVIASRISSLICEICLDAAPCTLASIAPPPETLATLDAGLRERVIGLIKSGSRPLLFFMLTSLLRKAKHRDGNLLALRNELEEGAGLKNFAVEAREAKQGLHKLLGGRTNSNPQYQHLMRIISENIRIEKKTLVYNFYDYKLPAVLLSGDVVFDLNRHFHPDQPAVPFNPLEHARWMQSFQNWL